MNKTDNARDLLTEPAYINNLNIVTRNLLKYMICPKIFEAMKRFFRKKSFCLIVAV